MEEKYRILYQGGSAELVEKKSRFIATLRPVHTEEEAAAFIEEMRKQYWDASHNCYAWILGGPGALMRCSDDGEPAQTAGRPMLDVLLGEKLYETGVVVTRYFGGTLLGTGGLVRAYQGAVQEGLKACRIVEKQKGKKLAFTTDYSGIGKVQYYLAKSGVTILEQTFTEHVELTVLVSENGAEKLIKEITELLGGRVEIREDGEVSMGLLGKEVWIL